MPEAKAKTIDGDTYTISQPYEEGHTITAIEARVLNQTRAENIGNNVRAKLKEMKEAGESAEALQAYVSEVDAEYEFTASAARAAAKLDPVEREALKMARALLKDHLAESGRKLTVAPEGSGMTDEEWKEKVDAEAERIAASDEVMKAAKKEVDARNKRADSLATALEATNL